MAPPTYEMCEVVLQRGMGSMSKLSALRRKAVQDGLTFFRPARSVERAYRHNRLCARRAPSPATSHPGALARYAEMFEREEETRNMRRCGCRTYPERGLRLPPRNTALGPVEGTVLHWKGRRRRRINKRRARQRRKLSAEYPLLYTWPAVSPYP